MNTQPELDQTRIGKRAARRNSVQDAAQRLAGTYLHTHGARMLPGRLEAALQRPEAPDAGHHRAEEQQQGGPQQKFSGKSHHSILIRQRLDRTLQEARPFAHPERT